MSITFASHLPCPAVGLLDRFRPPKPYGELSPQEADKAVTAGALLLDLRAQDEWDAGHAPLALHVPAGKLAERVPKLPKGRELVLVCRSGGRSRAHAELLAAKGVRVAYVSGGMRAWAKAGLGVITSGDRPGRVA